MGIIDVRFIIGLIGSLLLVSGDVVRSQSQKNILFAVGNAGMFAYAAIGYMNGGSIFFLILQLFIAISTLCMLLQVSDKVDTIVLAVGGLALVAWSLSHFQGYSTAVFVIGLIVLGIGFAMDSGTLKREVSLMLGSAIIAGFSFLMQDWIFFGLNALFALISLVNIARMRR